MLRNEFCNNHMENNHIAYQYINMRLWFNSIIFEPLIINQFNFGNSCWHIAPPGIKFYWSLCIMTYYTIILMILLYEELSFVEKGRI